MRLPFSRRRRDEGAALDPMIAMLATELWVMPPEHVEAFLAELGAMRAQWTLELAGGLRGRMDDDETPPLDIADGVARIRIEGPVVKTVPGWARWYGIKMAGATDIRADLDRALADSRVRSIMLVVDSPGGTLSGVQELADGIFNARAQKPITTHGSDLVASAAYWLGSQASKFTANEAAQIGSIGVFTVLADASRLFEDAGVKVHVVRSAELKGAGTFGAPITEAHLAKFQATVDGAAALFKSAVARGRKMKAEDVEKVATGECWFAAQALELGLIDAIASFDDAHRACVPPPATSMPLPVTPARATTIAIEPDAVVVKLGERIHAAAQVADEHHKKLLEQHLTQPQQPTKNTPAPEGAEGRSTMTEEEIRALQAENARLKEEKRLTDKERELTEKASRTKTNARLIEEAQADGRLPPAMVADAEAYAAECGADVPRFERWLKSLEPKTKKPQGSLPNRPAETAEDEKDAKASKDDRAAAKRCGVGMPAVELAEQIAHYTCDGGVVLKDGTELTKAELQKKLDIKSKPEQEAAA